MAVGVGVSLMMTDSNTHRNITRKVPKSRTGRRNSKAFENFLLLEMASHFLSEDHFFTHVDCRHIMCTVIQTSNTILEIKLKEKKSWQMRDM